MSTTSGEPKECIVIGAGISGLAMSRWLKGYDIDHVVIERSDDVGGLWRYRDNGYGVMAFTHINVSKYNYCYSDHQFPQQTADYPHHSEMYKYIRSYADKFQLFENILFNTEAVLVEELNKNEWQSFQSAFSKIKTFDKLWKVEVKDLKTGQVKRYVTPYVSIASGHHATPVYADFPGQETFPGEIIHSVSYKSATLNGLLNKSVLVVGIGNSAVDAAVNLVNEGKCKKVYMSSRSGAWVVPNYISGFATDLYASRALLSLPWKVSSFIFESTVKLIYGNPKKYNLNPKMRIMQTQPTVSPTLIHHIQRKDIQIVPNIKSINGSEVTFDNEKRESFDAIILCTGYKISLNYLSDDLKRSVFKDKDETVLNLYKNVFYPNIGRSLGFIGFLQPTSGGLLTMSEMQARWHVQLMLNREKLPSKSEMFDDIEKDIKKNNKRFYASKRHTIQKDPIVYNDEIGQLIGAKPNFIKNFDLLWKLNGPDLLPEAKSVVKSVPMTDMMKFAGLLFFLFVFYLILQSIRHPYIFAFLAVSYLFYRNYYKSTLPKKD